MHNNCWLINKNAVLNRLNLLKLGGFKFCYNMIHIFCIQQNYFSVDIIDNYDISHPELLYAFDCLIRNRSNCAISSVIPPKFPLCVYLMAYSLFLNIRCLPARNIAQATTHYNISCFPRLVILTSG